MEIEKPLEILIKLSEILITDRLDKLDEHDIRQIDENRKISRRVDELEKLNQECFDANPIADIENKFKVIETTLADNIRHVNERINNIEDEMKGIKVILDIYLKAKPQKKENLPIPLVCPTCGQGTY